VESSAENPSHSSHRGYFRTITQRHSTSAWAHHWRETSSLNEENTQPLRQRCPGDCSW